MRLTLPLLVPAGIALLLAAGCNRSNDAVSTYTVPKEQQPAQAQPGGPMMATADSTMPASDIPVGNGHLTWTTPSTWQELAPTSMRIGNFAIHGADSAEASVAIFSFPGSVGTELGNVNRWRGELKLEPITEDKIVSTPVTVDSIEGKLYVIPSDTGETVAASVPRGDSTWFFKMWGDKKTVEGARPAFAEFLKSIHFAAPGTGALVDAGMQAATQSAPGDLVKGAPAESSPSAEPKLDPPSNWTETQPGPMIYRSFSAADEGKTAKVTISFLGGTGGGVFANVGRWRGQLGLPAIDDDKAAAMMQTLDTAGGKATMVDFTGTDVKTGRPARLVAAIVPHGDSTWFYKLMGDDAVVEIEKAPFIKFVQTVRYP